MSHKLASMIAAICLATTNAVVCEAQVEQGAISGRVVDASGASIPKAKVTATNTATQAVASTETTEDGNYRLPYLTAGTYNLAAEKGGFSLGRVKDVPVLVGQIATIDVILRPGTVHEEVTVTANTVQIEQQSSSLGYVTGTTQILELPISRNPYALMTLSPGVIATGNSGTGPIVNGGRSNTTAILFDGQDTRNNSTLDNNYTPPMETVAEVRFITNSFSAEYGRSAGGVLTSASKTGTNQVHGSVYEYMRNNVLNANSWSNNRNGLKLNPVRHNEYGFSLGGPAYIPRVYDGRNKTFFFFNWEQMKDRSPNNVTGTLPTPLQRAGDFSQTVTAAGALIRIYDPSTTRLDPANPGFYIRDVFPNNAIPANKIDPNALKILSYYPLPNLPNLTGNYAVAATRTDSWNKYFIRADHNFGDRNRLFFRYGIQVQPTTNPFTSPAFPSEGTNGENGTVNTRGWTAVLSDTHTFKPNLIGEFRMGVARSLRVQTIRSAGFDLTTLGLPAYLNAASTDRIFPRIDVSDINSLGPDRASHNIDSENTPEPQAHFTWITGSHAIKTGLDVLFCQFNTFRPERPSGQFGFTRGYTQGPNPAVASATAGYGIATLLLGVPSNGSFSVGPSLALLQKSYNWYFNDDWKVARGLTINLGVRYEYQTPWTERYNQLAYFDRNATDPITGLKGLLVPTTASQRYPSDPQKRNWAPRVGIVWTFAKDTVFRAGYGLFYAPGSGGIGSAPSDLGSGSFTSTPINLGPATAAPNTPPTGATLTNPFTTGLLPFPNSLVGNGISAIFRDWRTPMNQMWNVNIQRNVTKDLLVEVAYIGSRGQRLWNNYNANAVSPQFLGLGTQLNSLVPNPFFGKITNGGLAGANVNYNNLLRPYPQYGDINWLRASIGDSVYHGLTLRAERRFSRGLLFQSSFTFAKLIDNVNERFVGGANFVNPYNLSQSRSVSPNDISQRWVSNFVYELPFGRGKKWLSKGIGSWILGNWEASGIYTMQVGTPIAIGAACATSLPGIGCTAIRLRNGNLPAGQQTMDKWFDPTAWVSPPQFSMGNDSRTQTDLRNPGAINFDTVFSRWQPIREGMRLQFRAEMYNVMNHPNLAGPATGLTATNVGQITNKNGSRTMQVALVLRF